MSFITSRHLGVHERCIIGFTDSWHSMIITNLVTFPDRLPLRQELHDSAINLVEQFPHLGCCIPDSEAYRPRFQSIPSDQFHLASRFREKPIPQGGGTEDETRGLILDKELDDGHRHFDLAAGVLWNVTRYHGTDGEMESGYIAFTIHHVLTDGLGAARLTMQLLSSGRVADGLELTGLAPTLEETINLHSGYWEVAKAAFNFRVVPYLPCMLARCFTMPDATHWPYHTPRSATTLEARPDPRHQESRYLVFTLRRELVLQAKLAGKWNGVHSLHPILSACWVAACYCVEEDRTKSGQTFDSKICSPFSVRGEDDGQPWATGNYIGECGHRFELCGEEGFWQIARSYAIALTDPVKKEKGTKFWFSQQLRPGNQRTGQEAMFLAATPPECPSGGSALLSNVGLVYDSGSGLIPGMSAHVWAQSRNPFGPAVCLNFSGVRDDGGSDICISWGYRADAAANGSLSTANMERMSATYVEILARVVCGHVMESPEDAKMSSLKHSILRA